MSFIYEMGEVGCGMDCIDSDFLFPFFFVLHCILGIDYVDSVVCISNLEQ